MQERGFGRVELGCSRCVYFLTFAFGNHPSRIGSEGVIQLYDRQPILQPGPFFLSVRIASFKDLLRLEDKNSNRRPYIDSHRLLQFDFGYVCSTLSVSNSSGWP